MKGYILSMVVGLMTLPVVTHIAYHQRGYKAIGGEFLVPVLIVIGYALYQDFKRFKHQNKINGGLEI